ncbi:MAG: amidohydrolase [Planctomycetes bacterium]|nr:amidohydrolase [Planctomycetota bacterium]
MTLVDSHVHVWVSDPRYPWAAETTKPPDRDATVEMLLQEMDAHGVEKTVLVQVIYYRWDNRYTSDCLRRFPHRFEGVCRVNPHSPQAADDLALWVREQGFRGVRLSPSAGPDGDWISDGTTDRIWAQAQELDVPMTILTSIERLPDIQKMASKFDGLRVVIDHLAWPPLDRPDLLRHLLALSANPCIYLKISGMWHVSKQPFPFRDAHDTWRQVYETFGPERLMWGTDWPVSGSRLTYGQALSLVRDELDFLTSADKEWVLGGTALKLWPFKPTRNSHRRTKEE